jgi:hypothetical protein
MPTTDEAPDTESLTTVPADLAALIFEQLAPGERIAWCGQPRARALVRGNYGFFIIDLVVGLLLAPTMVLLLALAFATIEFVVRAPVFTKEAFGVAILVCLPLPVMVLFCGALLRTRARAASTAYVVTDRQALIISTRPTRKIAPYAPADLTDAQVRRRRGEMGDIILSRGPAAKANGATWNIIYGVQDADRVMHLIRELAATRGGGGQESN